MGQEWHKKHREFTTIMPIYKNKFQPSWTRIAFYKFVKNVEGLLLAAKENLL